MGESIRYIRCSHSDNGQQLGVSENSVPLKPMVLLIIIPMKNGYFIGNIPNILRQTQLDHKVSVSKRPDSSSKFFFTVCKMGLNPGTC